MTSDAGGAARVSVSCRLPDGARLNKIHAMTISAIRVPGTASHTHWERTRGGSGGGVV